MNVFVSRLSSALVLMLPALFLLLPGALFAEELSHPPVQPESQPGVHLDPGQDGSDGLLAPMACDVEGHQSSGAIYRICMPVHWNGDLLIYAHGYVSPLNPVGLPEDQLTVNGIAISDVANLLGYAFATSSYSTNGLAVRPAQDDLVELVEIFRQEKGEPERVLLAGVSEGGLITTLLVEQRPDVFDGGLALCGPYGGFKRQIEYLGDARVLFDYFYPGLLPPSPMQIPAWLLDDWDTVYEDTILPVLMDPNRTGELDQLLAVSQASYDTDEPGSKILTVERLLWYNVFATNDAVTKLGDQPFGNLDRVYTGSMDDVLLNLTVQRFAAGQTALDEMAQFYEPQGQLSIPLVTMHTGGDPIVPSWHASLYETKTRFADNVALHEHIPIDRYGHCRFTLFELLNAFRLLRAMVNEPPPYEPPFSIFHPSYLADFQVPQ